MVALSLLPGAGRREFRRLRVSDISRNPNQPRRLFDAQALAGLADSIRRYGVITPLTVRRRDTGYELIAGERRLRASIMAGLHSVPCYIVSAEDEDSSLMALVENLQRRDLDFFEQAQGLRRLTELYGMTQQQAAEKIGMTQSAVANKLRLLHLAPETVAVLRQYGLSERHARALLRLSDPAVQAHTAEQAARHGLNVSQTEALVDSLLAPPAPRPGGQRRGLIRDVRLFLNTLDRAVAAMQTAGVGAQVEKQRCGDALVLTIRIPDARAGAPALPGAGKA